MIAFIGLASIIGFLVSIVMLIIASIKKTPKKEPLICTISCFCLFLICVSLPGGTESKVGTTRQSTPPAVVSTEPTQDELAEELKESAIKSFASGNYKQGFATCEKITTDYPDAEISSSIDDFISGQLDQYLHISARDLMAKYDENLVNADKEYTDRVVVVSGTVSSIGKTNGDRNLVVVLDSGTYFKGVQFNFNTDHEDAVAELRAGDSVQAIGKCTGLSGKVLLVIDGSNIMIENCYLLN